LISGLQSQPAELLASTGLIETVGQQNIFPRTGLAIDTAIGTMDRLICATCQYAAFHECPDLKRRGLLETADFRGEI
jgi:hypothetical protein